VKEHVAMFVVRIREIIAVLMVSSVVKELAAMQTRPAVTATAILLVVSAVFMNMEIRIARLLMNVAAIQG